VLAEVYYGSQRYTNFLMQANPQVTDPNRLAVGTTLRVPPLGERAPAAVRPPGPGTSARTGTYTVRAGDSFYSIARDVLGEASRWRELLELNNALVNGEPTNLRVGQVVQLPAEVSGSGR
jgi:nucleoid-associated protein YgaU